MPAFMAPVRVNVATTADALADTILTAGLTTRKPLVVQGKASQTANLTQWQSSTGGILHAVGSDGSLQWGSGSGASDTNLYRNAAAQIRTGGSLMVDTTIFSFANITSNFVAGTEVQVGGVDDGTGPKAGLRLGGDTFLYRSAAGAIKMPADLLVAGGDLTIDEAGSGAQTPSLILSSNSTAGPTLTATNAFSTLVLNHAYASATDMSFQFVGVEKAKLTSTGAFSAVELAEKKVTFTPTTVGWYRVVAGAGGNVGGVVRLSATYDNTVTDIELQYNVSGYGQPGSIQQTRYAYYNAGAISQARISSDGGSNAYLDVYVSTATVPGPITVYAYGPMQQALVAAPVVGAVAGSTSVETLLLGHGLRTTNVLQAGSLPAQTGTIRLPHASSVYFRNAANSGDVVGLSFSDTNTYLNGSNNINLTVGGSNVAYLDSANFNVVGNLTIADAKNIVLASTTGTKIGTATTQKIGFFGSTPIVQPSNTTDLRNALINLGLYASGGATGLDLNGGALSARSLTTTGNATNDTSLYLRVTGDSLFRLYVNPDGAMMWGTGALAWDTNLYRGAADRLVTDDDFQARRVSVGTTPNVDFMVNVAGNHPTTAANAYGIVVQPTMPASVVTNGMGIYAQVRTAAAAFTQANSTALYVDSPSLGAASAITTAYGLMIQTQDVTGVGTGYGIYQGGGADQNYFAGTSTFANPLSLSGAATQIYLTNATSKNISFGSAGVGPPTFTTRSLGTKIIFYDGLTGVATDYAIGIDASVLWQSVPTTGAAFKWYGGTTLAATMTGTGTVSFGTAAADHTLTLVGASWNIVMNSSTSGPSIDMGAMGQLAAQSGKTGLAGVSGRPLALSFVSSTLDIMSGGFAGTKVAEFGSTYLAVGSAPASTGIIRVPYNNTISWRNAANTGDTGGLLYTGDILQAISASGFQHWQGGVLGFENTTSLTKIATAAQIGTNPALTGVLRLPNDGAGTGTIIARNATNSGDIKLLALGADNSTYIGTGLAVHLTQVSGVAVLSASAGAVTLADATNLLVGSTTGTKIGTATTQKLAFFNSTPIVQPAGTTDLRQALINLGLYATGGATPLNLNGGTLTAAALSMSGSVTMADGANVVLGTTTGTKFGTATTQKQGWWNATPVVRATIADIDAPNATLNGTVSTVNALLAILRTYGLVG